MYSIIILISSMQNIYVFIVCIYTHPMEYYATIKKMKSGGGDKMGEK